MSTTRDELHAIYPGAEWSGILGPWLDGDDDPITLASDYTAQLRVGETNGDPALVALTHADTGLELADDGTVTITLTGAQTWTLRGHGEVAVDLDVMPAGGAVVALMRASAAIGTRVGSPS